MNTGNGCWIVVAVALVVGCGEESGGGDSPGAETGTGTGTQTATGTGTDTVTESDAWAHWDFLAATEGPKAAERLARCAAICGIEGACGFQDPGSCQRRCNDPRKSCQAEMAEPSCWVALSAYETCLASLTCAELNHLHYSGSSVRACQAEIDALEPSCGYTQTIASAECIGDHFVCESDSKEISPYWVCDGERDCADGSDEEVCPWLHGEPANACIESATIDAEDTTGDLAALAGVTCINRQLTISGTPLGDLQGLEALSSVGSLVIGGSSSLFSDATGNPQLSTLNGLSGLRGVGSLTISGNPMLTDLSALSGLTFVTSKLEIENNDALASLEGLHQIEYVDELILSGNSALADLRGLRGLTFLGGLTLTNNPLVEDFSGFEQLPWIGSLGATISGNAALVDFTGFTSLTGVGNSFSVSNNDHLASFAGLEAMTRFSWSVSIRNNPVLSDLDALSGVTEIRSDVMIEGNPLLPQCAIDAWLTPLGLNCGCSENDETATCG